MSVVAFLNIGMHGYVNPTLPVVAELVRRGHEVVYWTSPQFHDAVTQAGADARTQPGGDMPPPDPPVPLAMLDTLARTALRVLPDVLDELRAVRPDLIVHGAACPWGAVAARELGVPAVSLFTTFAFGRAVASPTRPSAELLRSAVRLPGIARSFARSRWALARRYFAGALPLTDLLNVREPLNLVFTTRSFQPGADDLGPSYRFVGASVGSRPADPTFPDRLDEPVLFASLGTVFDGGADLLRTLVAGLAPLGGTVVLATGRTDPADLGTLPGHVVARQSVPQPQVLGQAALFVTHGGMNSVNEAMLAGVPMLVLPQGADQPLVAEQVVRLGAGLSMRPQAVTAEAVTALARRLLDEPGFRDSAHAQRAAQHDAGGAVRAADELERHLRHMSSPGTSPSGEVA